MKYMKKSFSNMEPYFSKLITDGIIMNANESPVNPPKAILDEFYEAIKNVDFNRYPDMAEETLCEALAKHYNVKKNEVTVGVGSDELLDVTFRAVLEKGDNVVGFSPSFSMYKVFTELMQANYIAVYGDENYIFNVDDMIKAIKEYNPKMVLICTPNNPTGQHLNKKEIIRVIESTNALILLDLAYIDFAEEDYIDLASKYDNVIGFKTYSKAMALPSIRVGYAISNEDNINMIKAVKPPYSVTSLSQIMATIAINNFDLYKDQINAIKNERERLYKELNSLGFKVYPSSANFIFVVMDDKYNDLLLENKIYIRKFNKGIYRISIGTKEENNKLLEVIKNAK